jgi:hypothetical protein
MERIDHFAYEHDFLSNFYPVAIVMEGAEYGSVEHAYQAAKVLNPEKRRILTLDFNPNLTAGQAKKVGRNLDLRDDWDEVKALIMRELLFQKFGNPALRARLLATGTAELVEGNYWEDRHWGVCYGGLPTGFDGRKCKKWPHDPAGDNKLGQLLMEIRFELLSQKESWGSSNWTKTP